MGHTYGMLARAAFLVMLFLGCSGQVRSEQEPEERPEQEEPGEGPEPEEGSPPTRLELLDASALCLQSSADGSLTVRALGGRCFSSSCTTVIRASCDYEQSGNEITVHSFIEVERSQGPRNCITDCMPISADCAPLSAEPGEYTFRHGESSVSVELPAERRIIFRERGYGAGCGDFSTASPVP